MSTTGPYTRPLTPMKKSNNGFWLIIGVGALVLILILNKALGALSYNFFVAGDNFFKLSEHIPPFVMWGVGGILIGAIIGSIVVCIKYKLALKWLAPPIAGSILIFTVFLLLSGPLLSNEGQRTVKRRDGSKYVEISASTALPKYQHHEYGPDLLLDNDDSTAWMYIEKAGKPATVNYVFKGAKMDSVSNVQLIGIRFAPGYQKNYDKWQNSNKPKDYVIYKNSEQVLTGTLEDHFGNEEVAIKNLVINAGDTIKVEITSSYKPLEKKVNIIAVSMMYPVISVREPRD